MFSEKVIREAGTGKLTIINSFQRFYGTEFPFSMPSFVVTVAFTGLVGKLEKLKLAVELVDPPGQPIVEPVTTEVSSVKNIEADETFELSFIVPPSGFPAAGVYHVQLRINEDIVGKRPLPIALAPPPEDAAAPAPEPKRKNLSAPITSPPRARR